MKALILTGFPRLLTAVCFSHAQRMVDEGITRVKMFYDGALIRHLEQLTYWNFKPDYNFSTSYFISNHGIGFSKSQSVAYQVIDQNRNITLERT